MRLGWKLPTLYFTVILFLLGRAELNMSRLPEQTFGKDHRPHAVRDSKATEFAQPVRGTPDTSGPLHVPVHIKRAWTNTFNIGLHKVPGAPAVDASGVYVGSDSGWLFALDFDGSTRWRFYVRDQTGGMAAPPDLDTDSVCFAAYLGKFYCLTKTGRFIWSSELRVQIEHASWSEDGAIYVTGTSWAKNQGFGKLFRLARATGVSAWNAVFPGPVGGPPLSSLDTNVIVVYDESGHLYAYDKADGHSLWAAKGAPKPTLAIAVGGTFYVGAEEGLIEALDFATGRRLWKIQEAGTKFVVDKLARRVIAYSPATRQIRFFGLGNGRETAGRLRADVDIDVRAVIAAGQREIALADCRERQTCLIDLKSGRVLASCRETGRNSSSYALYDRSAYAARADGEVFRLNVSSP